MRIVSAVALIAVPGTTPGQAAEPLQPTAKWNVDFGNSHCIALRDYGTAAAPLTLALKPAPIGDVMQVSLLRGSSKRDTDQYAGTMTVGSSVPVKVSVLGYPATAGKTRLISINLAAPDFLPLRTASVLRLTTAREVDRSFALSQMASVTTMLDRCVANLRKAWNITNAVNDPHATPKAPLYSYFNSVDYPSVAARGDATGTVALVMLVDEAGKVASCMVTQTSGYASLDAQSCALLTVRAKFKPAVVDGQPVKSGQTLRINWRLP